MMSIAEPGTDAGMRHAVHKELGEIEPFDAVERMHLADAMAWVESGAPLWRTTKPATPPNHLVS
jgi:8-oxo-dGTP diphosphatase